ncbi:O-antigen ligase family protein [Acidicapsa acidisoli]|uniref:O-antigen ligase family protein n=1 Tax=Acidicapsa acidisoli TaxID=1615681 RepID=UPI0021DFC31A|nr:O-antigen ligase [Acidicapsa acidisoli]
MKNLEQVMLFLLLMLSTGAGQSLITGAGTATSSEGQPVMQVIFGLLYLALFFFLLMKFRKTAISLIQRERWTIVVCLWVLASTIWSGDPSETFRRAVALVGTSMAGLYIGMRYDLKQQLKMIALVVGLGAIASLAAGLLFPGIGLTADGSWQGIYFLKNALGRMMALGSICFALLALSERRHRLIRIGMLLLCCVLMLLSKSATAVVVTFLMFVALFFRRALYLRIRPLIGLAAVIGAVGASVGFWFVENSDRLLHAVGRNSSLTGRIPLWQLVFGEISARPIQGYGFAAFWNSWEGERVSETVNWEVSVPHAHNGFLEVWLGIGIVGLVLLLIGMWRIFRSSLHTARTHREIDQSWPLVLLIFTVLYNLTESSLLSTNSLLWMAYVANSFWLVRSAEEEKRALVFDEVAEPAYSS